MTDILVKKAEAVEGVYDADYYLRGRESGKSLYADYRWLPNLTLPLAHWLVTYAGIQRCDTILDFGCARGYVVKALRMLGYQAFGIDCSEWAVENADEEIQEFVSRETLPPTNFDWIIAKDVLEHIPTRELDTVLDAFAQSARRGFVVVVPLSPKTDAPYAVPEYECDVTHIQRLTLEEWALLIRAAVGEQFTVMWTYRLPGVKDNYSQFPNGNGFLIAKRV